MMDVNEVIMYKRFLKNWLNKRMDIVTWGNKLGNVCMLMTNDVNLWLIGMNALDKFGSINLNQHSMNDGNEQVNISRY